MRDVSVWGLATRAFHWLLVALVVVCLLTGEDEGLVFAVHAYVGYVVLPLVVFRVGWGVFGSLHARFTDFVFSAPAVLQHAGSLLRLESERHVGHNPLGGWMVVVMLIALVVAALTGIVMVIDGSTASKGLHEASGSFIQILVLVHIAGALAHRLLTGEKLVRATITGRKELPEDLARREPALVGPARALALAVLVAIGGGYLFDRTDYAAKVAAFATEVGENKGRDDERD